MSILQIIDASAAPWGKPLLHSIDLTLEAGRVLGIVGPNGAGKTTLLRAIAGDVPLARGELLLNGRPLHTWERLQRARTLAYLPQLSLLNFPYTVEEVILLGRGPHDSGAEVDRQILGEVAELADVSHLQDRLYTRLSGGEKQRVQLARIYAQIWQDGSLAGKLLLLDEPTTALDIAHQQGLARTVAALAARGCAVVLVIHDFNTIASLADQLLVIDRGSLAASGEPADVLTRDLFHSVFAADVSIEQTPGRSAPVVLPR